MCDLPVELPHDYDIENCVIRELLFGPEECLPVIRKYGGEDLFSKMLYGIVFQAACEMIETGVGIDQLTMTAHLAGTGRLEMIGGEIEVAALFGDPAYYGNIADHCRMLAELAARREITRHCRYAVQRSVDRAESLPELIGDLGDTLRKAAALLGESGHSLSDDVRDWVLSSNGHFMSSDVVTDLALSSRVDKKNCSKILKRLVEEGLIERWGNRRGCFRKIDGDCARIDLSIPRCEPLPFTLAAGVGEARGADAGQCRGDRGRAERRKDRVPAGLRAPQHGRLRDSLLLLGDGRAGDAEAS